MMMSIFRKLSLPSAIVLPRNTQGVSNILLMFNSLDSASILAKSILNSWGLKTGYSSYLLNMPNKNFENMFSVNTSPSGIQFRYCPLQFVWSSPFQKLEGMRSNYFSIWSISVPNSHIMLLTNSYLSSCPSWLVSIY